MMRQLLIERGKSVSIPGGDKSNATTLPTYNSPVSFSVEGAMYGAS